MPTRKRNRSRPSRPQTAPPTAPPSTTGAVERVYQDVTRHVHHSGALADRLARLNGRLFNTPSGIAADASSGERTPTPASFPAIESALTALAEYLANIESTLGELESSI